MSIFDYPPPMDSFDAECRHARELAESVGLLSMTFMLEVDSPIPRVRATNGRTGASRLYARAGWLEAVKVEIDGGALGRTYRIGEEMKRRLDQARAAESE